MTKFANRQRTNTQTSVSKTESTLILSGSSTDTRGSWPIYIRKPQIKKFYKTEPPKSGNFDSKYNLKISKTKNQAQKRPPKAQKNKKKYIRRLQIKKFYKTEPPKSGNSDSKYNFQIFENKNQTQKRPPKVPKK